MLHTAFILASASPRRKELLTYLSLPHTYQYVIDTDEIIDEHWEPQEAVMRLSVNKGLAVFSELLAMPHQLDIQTKELSIIAADTVVVSDGHILGKPKNKQDAFQMLSSLQGRTHEVFTGLSLLTSIDRAMLEVKSDLKAQAERLNQVILQQIDRKTDFLNYGKIGEFVTCELDGHSARQVKIGYTRSQVTFRPLTDSDIWRYIETGDPLDKAGSYGIQGIGAVNIEAIDGDFYSVMGLPLSMLYTFIV